MYYSGVGRGASVRLSWGGSLVRPTLWAVPADSTEVVRDDFNLRLILTMEPHSFLWASLTVSELGVARGP